MRTTNAGVFIWCVLMTHTIFSMVLNGSRVNGLSIGFGTAQNKKSHILRYFFMHFSVYHQYSIKYWHLYSFTVRTVDKTPCAQHGKTDWFHFANIANLLSILDPSHM